MPQYLRHFLSVTKLGRGDRIASYALRRCGVLEASFCARPHSAEPALTIFASQISSRRTQPHSRHIKIFKAMLGYFYMAGPRGSEYNFY